MAHTTTKRFTNVALSSLMEEGAGCFTPLSCFAGRIGWESLGLYCLPGGKGGEH